MVEYKCSRCSKVFVKKYNFDKHQKRKYPCKKIKFSCEFCNKKYSTKSNLNKHIKKCNKNNKIVKINELEIMKKKIDYLMKQKNNIYNTNIIINNFGNESLKSIKKDFIIDLFKKPIYSVPKLIDTIHFNNKVNKNLYLSKESDSKILILENGEWKIKDTSNTVKLLVNKNFDRIDDFFENYKNELDKNKVNDYTKYAEDFDNGKNKDIINKDVFEILKQKSK